MDDVVSTRVETNSSIKIRCQLTAHARLESPVLKIKITKINGDVVWATSTQRGANSIRVLDGPAIATLDISALPLLEGAYFISASITDATGTTEYDHCQNWIRFDVHQTNLFEEGVVAINSTWQLERSHR